MEQAWQLWSDIGDAEAAGHRAAPSALSCRSRPAHQSDACQADAERGAVQELLLGCGRCEWSAFNGNLGV